MYKDILRKAWQITWKHKYLWLFGLFATILSSAGASAWDLFFTNTTRVFDQPEYLQNLKILYSSGTLGLVFDNVSTNLSQFWTLSADVYILIALMLGLVAVAIIAQGALIHASASHEDGKDAGIQESVFVARKSFWKLTGLQALFQLAIYGSLAVIGAPLLSLFLIKGIELPGMIFSFISYIVLLPLSIILYFILLYASIFTVINKSAIWKSSMDAWHLFKSNWIVSLEFALLLFVINIVIGFFFVLILAVPAVIIIQSQTTITVFSIWSLILMLIIFLLVSGILTTFQFSATVLFVKRIAKNQNHGILGRFFMRLLKKTNKNI